MSVAASKASLANLGERAHSLVTKGVSPLAKRHNMRNLQAMENQFATYNEVEGKEEKEALYGAAHLFGPNNERKRRRSRRQKKNRRNTRRRR